MIAKIQIQLATVVDTQSVFDIFASTFSFPLYFGNNWDALYDMMSSLDPTAAVFQHLQKPLTGVHLILDNFDMLESHLGDDQLTQFKSLLFDLCMTRELRSDYLSFTFEIR